MGKLKFTLSNIWFWVALVFVCFLTENLSLLTSNIKEGFNVATLVVLSAGCLLCLFMYFFINHKENKMKFDWVLMPAIAIVGLSFLVAIWTEQGGTYQFENGSGSITVAFTTFDRIRASVILILFLLVTYAFMFMMNVNRPSNRIIVLMAYVGIAAAVISVIYSLATEMDAYVAIFQSDELPAISIDSFYGNKNYYGGVLFIGILTCFIVNYYRPRLHWYILMCFLFVILISTAAVLPTLIASVAVPVYLLEETVRFAIKKKWKYSVFALVSILILMALSILFFYGSTHQWNGFLGLDAYITQTFESKDFFTFTGRTKIWETVFPMCFDSPLHIIFGHGFMLSEKLLVGITGAFNNDPTAGVRTTHNGYLETMFDYGMIGTIIHVVLIAYFVYCAIRLLLKKRFHFVFIHLFVVACCAAYNFCESSSFFDAGVKEIFMTMVFMVPVMAEYKMRNHPEKMEEIKNHPAEKKAIDSIRLGQTVAIILMSLLVTVGCSLVVVNIYDINLVKHIVLNIVIGVAICLFFVPYLVNLYYKGQDKLQFVLHAVFNGILIPAVIAIIYIFCRQDLSTHQMAVYLIPGLLFFILLIEVIAYSFIKNGSVKEWFDVTIKGSFVVNRYAIVGGVLMTLLPSLVLQTLGVMNYYIYIVCVIIGLIGYYMVFHFFPTKTGKEILDSFNELAIWNIKRIALKDEKYDG